MESNRDETLKVVISAASVCLAQLIPEPPLTYRTELELQGAVLTHEGNSDGHHPMTIDIRLLFERVQMSTAMRLSTKLEIARRYP